MERRDVFENWFRSVNRDSDFDFDSYREEEESESHSKSTMHHSSKKMAHHRDGRGISASRCQRLANIIGGMVVSADPVCVVQRLRNIRATILGRRTRSPLALPFLLSFEDNGLNLGETVILQREINPMLTALRRRGIIVTAVHNHWLFDNPRLMYMHWENVGMSPEDFARNSIDAAREAGLFKH
jgi:hypothetical protein